MTNHTDGLDAAGVDLASVAFNEAYEASMNGSTASLSVFRGVSAAIATYLDATRRSALVDAPAGEVLCEDCPRVGHSTDATRCSPCPRRMVFAWVRQSVVDKLTNDDTLGFEGVQTLLSAEKSKYCTVPVYLAPTPSVAALQAENEPMVQIRRSDADIIRRMMEEFWRRKELSPEENSAFLSLCGAGDFGRPVPQT